MTTNLGFTQFKSNYSLFIKNDNNYFTDFLVYVDDLMRGNNLNEFHNLEPFTPNSTSKTLVL